MHESTLYPLKKLKGKVLIVSFCFLVSGHWLEAQSIFSYNFLADVELSKAGEDSHYYYNEIDQDNTGLRVGLSQLNVLGQLTQGSNWSFNVRLLLDRDKGRKLENFSMPQLNVQWLSNRRRIGITVGQFINPFGSFNSKQLSIDRKFVGLPLMYSFYSNISPLIGYLPDMGDITKVTIGDMVQWGSSGLYYGGYTAGAMMSWNIKPGKVNWKLAIVNGASNKTKRFTSPLNLGVISKLKLRPTYFWEQGISFSHGSFMQESEASEQLNGLSSYTQTMVGIDFKLGYGFFEFSGEMIGARYHVPQFVDETNSFVEHTIENPLVLNSLSAYFDIKYEFPQIQGSYIAYRLDHLGFGELDGSAAQNWDNDVTRHSLAIGYHITRLLLVRMAVSTQKVDNKSWDSTQRTFRLVFTAHH